MGDHNDDTILDDELDENDYNFDNEHEDALLAEDEYDYPNYDKNTCNRETDNTKVLISEGEAIDFQLGDEEDVLDIGIVDEDIVDPDLQDSVLAVQKKEVQFETETNIADENEKTDRRSSKPIVTDCVTETSKTEIEISKQAVSSTFAIRERTIDDCAEKKIDFDNEKLSKCQVISLKKATKKSYDDVPDLAKVIAQPSSRKLKRLSENQDRKNEETDEQLKHDFNKDIKKRREVVRSRLDYSENHERKYDRERNREYSRDRERERERDRARDREREKEKEIGRFRERDWLRDRDRIRDYDRDRICDRDSIRDREDDCDKKETHLLRDYSQSLSAAKNVQILNYPVSQDSSPVANHYHQQMLPSFNAQPAGQNCQSSFQSSASHFPLDRSNINSTQIIREEYQISRDSSLIHSGMPQPPLNGTVRHGNTFGPPVSQPNFMRPLPLSNCFQPPMQAPFRPGLQNPNRFPQPVRPLSQDFRPPMAKMDRPPPPSPQHTQQHHRHHPPPPLLLHHHHQQQQQLQQQQQHPHPQHQLMSPRGVSPQMQPPPPSPLGGHIRPQHRVVPPSVVQPQFQHPPTGPRPMHPMIDPIRLGLESRTVVRPPNVHRMQPPPQICRPPQHMLQRPPPPNQFPSDHIIRMRPPARPNMLAGQPNMQPMVRGPISNGYFGQSASPVATRPVSYCQPMNHQPPSLNRNIQPPTANGINILNSYANIPNSNQLNYTQYNQNNFYSKPLQAQLYVDPPSSDGLFHRGGDELTNSLKRNHSSDNVDITKVGRFSDGESDKIDEDDEMKVYRMKVENQKKLREQYVQQKEEQRLKNQMQNFIQNNIKDILQKREQFRRQNEMEAAKHPRDVPAKVRRIDDVEHSRRDYSPESYRRRRSLSPVRSVENTSRLKESISKEEKSKTCTREESSNRSLVNCDKKFSQRDDREGVKDKKQLHKVVKITLKDGTIALRSIPVHTENNSATKSIPSLSKSYSSSDDETSGGNVNRRRLVVSRDVSMINVKSDLCENLITDSVKKNISQCNIPLTKRFTNLKPSDKGNDEEFLNAKRSKNKLIIPDEDGSRTVWVRNISFSSKPAVLLKLANTCGSVSRTKWIYGGGQSANEAKITFSSADEAQKFCTDFDRKTLDVAVISVSMMSDSR